MRQRWWTQILAILPQTAALFLSGIRVFLVASHCSPARGASMVSAMARRLQKLIGRLTPVRRTSELLSIYRYLTSSAVSETQESSAGYKMRTYIGRVVYRPLQSISCSRRPVCTCGNWTDPSDVSKAALPRHGPVDPGIQFSHFKDTIFRLL